jgi:hypothetical protein
MQKRLGETFIDFRAQTRDMHVDDVGLRVKMVIPHVFQQHRAGNHLPGVLHQIFQQPKFPRLQRDFLISAADLMGQAVELKVTDPKDGFLAAADVTARKDLDPREQL